jgi:Nuclear protein Es2
MYVPDGDVDTDARLMPPPPPPGPPKEILHRNTRIVSRPDSAVATAVKKEDADREAVWQTMAATASDRQLLQMRKAEREGGNVDLANLLGTPHTAASPRVGGYGFVATPSPAPGVDMSPMTTWGRLDGTPLLLDPTDTPLDLTPGPAFKVHEPPRREEIAMRLADKAKASQNAKARSYAAPASPFTSRPSPALSPAGRSLVSSKMNKRKNTVGADMQLRASYASPQVGAGKGASKSAGGVTPSPLPSPSPLLASKTPTPSHVSSITDNLLDIPTRPTKKGKSITDDLLI